MVRRATSQLEKEQSRQGPNLVGKRAPSARHPGDNTPGKQRERRDGTAPAVSKTSGASSLARSWGGKRNSASRTNDYITFEQATNLIEAAQFAAAAGMPLNRHVTIHWEQAGISDERAAWATGRFQKLACDWIASRGGCFAWAWVRENDPVFGSLHGHAKGSHVHILMHLPDGFGIGRKQRRWLRSITGKPYRARTISTSRIGGRAGACQSALGHYRANLGSVVGYLLKGTLPKAAGRLGLTRREAGGRIIGRRVSTSENIGRTARLRAGAAGRG